MNTRWRRGTCFLLACAAVLGMLAAEAATVFAVTEPWVRVAPDGRSAEVFMQLRSSDGAAIVGVKSEVVTGITMRPAGTGRTMVARIVLPAGETVLLAPGAQRLAIPKLPKPLKLGDRVPLVLVVEGADGGTREISVNAEVRRRSPTDDHLAPHKHSHESSSRAWWRPSIARLRSTRRRCGRNRTARRTPASDLSKVSALRLSPPGRPDVR